MEAAIMRSRLERVQRELDSSMRSIQLAVLRLEAMGGEVSDTLAALREVHKQLFQLDRAIAEAIGGGEAAL